MEWIALWDILRRRWWLILLPTLVVFLLVIPSLPDTLNGQGGYSVTMRFTAAAASDIAQDESYEDSAYVPWLASEYVVVNLPHWVTSDTFAQEVSRRLANQGIEIPYEDVRSAFVADSAHSILVVYINWDDASEIEAIAKAAITVLQTRNQVYFPQFAAFPAEVTPLDDVRVNRIPMPLMDRLNPFLRLAVGLAIGLGLAVAAEYMDDSIRREEDLAALGLIVVGVVPAE
jgi:capsular polysaccharide biosynthesis protein